MNRSTQGMYNSRIDRLQIYIISIYIPGNLKTRKVLALAVKYRQVQTCRKNRRFSPSHAREWICE